MSAILFDMDGTLVDSEPLWLSAEIEIMQELGCTWTAEDQIACLGGPRAKTEKMMQEKSGYQMPDGYFGNQLDDLMELKLANELKIYDGGFRLIEECKKFGLKVGLVTASGSRLMNVVLQNFPKDIFDIVVSGDDVINSKPDPEPYLKAARGLSVEITQSVVIEDSLTGVTSGLAAGAQVIGIPHMIKLPENINLRLIDNIDDLNLDKLLNWYPFLRGN
jgi:HAD superfamily hydrolase (TIGR01509 family)